MAYSQAKDFMTANPDLAGIYVTAGGPFGAAKAVDEAGKTGKIKVVSFDFVDETMQYVQKGVISATIGQDPFAQGHDPAIRLYNYLVGGEAQVRRSSITRSDVVTKDNIDQFWKPAGARCRSSAAATDRRPSAAAAPAAAASAKDMCTPADEGTVKPVDKKPGKPMKIAVLGLENNPFWIPVKGGTLKAAEELKPYGVTVEWIVPGDQHTSDVFGQAVEVGHRQEVRCHRHHRRRCRAWCRSSTRPSPRASRWRPSTRRPPSPTSACSSWAPTCTCRARPRARPCAQAIGGKGKVAIITGFFAVEAHELRRKGFEDYAQEELPRRARC